MIMFKYLLYNLVQIGCLATDNDFWIKIMI